MTSHGGSDFGGRLGIILTSFTGSVVERTESDSPSRAKKIEKKIEGKKSVNPRGSGGFGRSFRTVPARRSPGVERESPAPVINTEL